MAPTAPPTTISKLIDLVTRKPRISAAMLSQETGLTVECVQSALNDAGYHRDAGRWVPKRARTKSRTRS